MNEQLTSAQIQQVRTAAERQVQQFIEQLQLRKWAVEQSFKVVGTPDELTKLAAAIYDFVVPPPVSKAEIDPDRPF